MQTRESGRDSEDFCHSIHGKGRTARCNEGSRLVNVPLKNWSPDFEATKPKRQQVHAEARFPLRERELQETGLLRNTKQHEPPSAPALSQPGRIRNDGEAHRRACATPSPVIHGPTNNCATDSIDCANSSEQQDIIAAESKEQRPSQADESKYGSQALFETKGTVSIRINAAENLERSLINAI